MSTADFTALFQHHRSALERLFRARGFGDQSPDLVQQTFLKALDKLPLYRRECSLEAWLFTIARNTYKNSVRNEKNERRLLGQQVDIEENPSFDRQPDPLSQLLKKEFRSLAANKLARSLLALPLQMRQCVVLRVYQELKYRQIAVTMKLEIGTIKSHLNQAKRRLKPLLEELDLHWDI